MNPAVYNQLKQTLAPERLDAYGSEDDAAELILARYLLNMALCESLYSPLQMAEIALRNGIHRELSTHFKTAEWFRNQASQTAWQIQKVKEAEGLLKAKAKPVTSGRIVAEMNFWVLDQLLQ